MDKLYWVDALLDRIEFVGIDGSGRQAFSNIGQITQPFSLTIHSGESHCHWPLKGWSVVNQPLTLLLKVAESCR